MNLPDGYRCICSPGYRLHPSEAYCTGTCLGILDSLSVWGGWEQGWGTESRVQAAEGLSSAVWFAG